MNDLRDDIESVINKVRGLMDDTGTSTAEQRKWDRLMNIYMLALQMEAELDQYEQTEDSDE